MPMRLVTQLVVFMFLYENYTGFTLTAVKDQVGNVFHKRFLL